MGEAFAHVGIEVDFSHCPQASSVLLLDGATVKPGRYWVDLLFDRLVSEKQIPPPDAPHGLTLRQVRYFIATAEFGQISQAAIHLNISQSAVTSAIQELEGMLGVALFTRTAQGMNLTDSGRHFLNHAYSIQRSVDDALNSPQPDTRVEGTLKVAASYTVMGYFLPTTCNAWRSGTRNWSCNCSRTSAPASSAVSSTVATTSPCCSPAISPSPGSPPKPCSTPSAGCGCPAAIRWARRPTWALPTWPARPTSCSPSTRPGRARCATGNRAATGRR